MKISCSWLKQYIPNSLNHDKISEYLTFCGLEVEHTETWCAIPGALKGLVVGEVLTCSAHPGADRLHITTVNTGPSGVLQIVCGAPNVAAGQKVIVALPGARLYPVKGEPFEIKKSKIRGEFSEGMICAEDEIGLGASHDGIMVLAPEAVPGTEASRYFNIEEDYIFEIGLTPNRVDAASHIGVARDLSALICIHEQEPARVVLPETRLPALAPAEKPVEVHVADTKSCPRYSGITLTGLKVAESPAWLKNKLLSIGLRPINNVVDITNFVLHETGQPLHAFDADKIKGNQVIVQKLHDKMPFITLDGVTREITSDDLMICHEDGPMCIAGVFGGESSGVTFSTTRVFIESAYFHPATIRKTSKRLALKTDASFRYERGADPSVTLFALQRAATLLADICGAQMAGSIFDWYPEEIKPAEIRLKYSDVNRLIGKEIPDEQILEITGALGMHTLERNESEIVVQVPTSKVDVTRPADLVEEILRIYGYNRIELPGHMRMPAFVHSVNAMEKLRNMLCDSLTGIGFHEIWNNSLSSCAYMQKLLPGFETEIIKIRNPLSAELDCLRHQMIWGMLQTAQYNLNRKQHNFKLYESGKCYRQMSNGVTEPQYVALLATGNRYQPHWHEKEIPEDFYSLKAYLNVLMKRAGVKGAALQHGTHPLAAGYAALKKSNEVICEIMEVKKEILRYFDIDQPVFYAEIHIDILQKYCQANQTQFNGVVPYPEVKRDLALMIDKKVTYLELQELAYKTEKKLLRKVSLFDVYEGDRIEEGKKSYAMSFILQDEFSTLTDKQIDKCMSRIVEAYQRDFGAILR